MYLIQPVLSPMLNELVMHQNITMRRLDLLEKKVTESV